LLGFGSTTSLSLQPYGVWLALAGAILLAGVTLFLARRIEPARAVEIVPRTA